ncbi:MAG: AMP-binding protein [Clostridiales bacterium]|jgi:acetyl-CoA synthetase|nr:AMP-binding protein [Clostridiales bacterium]
MNEMINIHQKFCKETFFNGQLERFEPVYEDNFNFAYDVMDVLAKEEPERRAMLWCNDKGEEHTFTFGDFARYSNQAANFFAAQGIGRGDTVVLVLKRHYEFWFALLGLHKVGAVGIPATNLLTKKDFVYRFNAAKVKAILCTTDGETLDHAEAALPESPTVKVKISVHGSRLGWLDFTEELKKQPETFDRAVTAATDPMLLYFTSGTTGMPKMVWHDYTYPIAHIVTAKYWHNVLPDGLHLTLSDTGWMKAMWGKLYGQWFMEAGIFVCDFDKFTPSELLPLFKKYNITTFCAPPTMYRFFIKEDLSKYDLSSLTHASIAGEPLNPEVFNQFYKATGLKLMEGFGQTETTLTLFNPVGTNPKPGSMGMPSPAYHVDLVDENGHTVEPGTVGEIVLRTEGGKPCGMFDGYYENPELTKTVWWDNIYHTGDTAWRDEDGYFWYVGRTDDIIKSSGYRIGPFEIESVIMELPYVLECAITGVPDPIRGQVVKATIVLANGCDPSEELKKEVQNYVKKQTAPYKYPRVVEFVEELPKTISGKIRRVQIRDEKKSI